MRAEFAGSALVHTGLIGVALLWLGLPAPEDAPAMGSVTVELIGTSLVTSNQSQSVESDAAVDEVSSGAEASIAPLEVSETLEEVPAETLEALSETIEPLPVAAVSEVAAEAAEPVPAETLEQVLPAVEAETVEMAETPPVEMAESVAPEPQTIAEPLLAAAALPLEAEDLVAAIEESPALEPEAISEAKTAPVPHMLSFTRPDAPTQRQASAPPPTRRQAPAPQQAGNGGASAQDTVAALSASGQNGAGGGGNADVARYPGQVERKLGRALRYPRDAGRASGEAEVHFVLDAGGRVLRVSLRRSSGNPIIDQAALDTVQRAAPYPPFPAGSGRTQWEFSIPLNFAR
ncbi:MAG: hypothetical protein ABS76_10510 [Pelagibacterium sp. SCN 64-44]|nr:MAG: hypothetical protein ABS76_10510 [Pelagibacterium sp. SCN 64-44]